MNRKTLGLPACLWLASNLLSGSAVASQLVYTPVNPSFGGNPLNGQWLLNNAQAQDDHKDPDLRSSALSPLDRFTNQLQSRLLSQLLTNVQNGNTGTLSTDDFIVNLVNDSGALTIQITDRATGEISEIVVDGLN
ncbi:curli assembly protein CsgF [compost metagenome]|uniref:Curli production assembly/transport component CsgF n=1 Tax=Pseudomonas jinjuensis TaxID=198616 RepID=A0A1G9Z853_9PSED|nr:curli assembly protein CsgF [Pseudomonas jinjuensis]SDN16796.1 curli production assembly/transport component CsgF [Pseudomonas jinjuensis]